HEEIGQPLTIEKIATHSNKLNAKNSAWKWKLQVHCSRYLIKMEPKLWTKSFTTLLNIINPGKHYYCCLPGIVTGEKSK
ncbi:MAG TPA: hypothetical protein VJU78_02085, partial [Chitinophagaceae bacterium]|nr:hypothetical protein [Chitinophagaceae bacterium]